MKALGQERYGAEDNTGGYSVSGFLRHGQIPSSELHAWMNMQVSTSLDLGHVAILEGGTRTRAAQAETLKGIELEDDGLCIFMLQLPFKEVVRRSRQRRRETERYDDRLPVVLAKLYGQYSGLRSDDAPRIGDSDVVGLNASLPTTELTEIVSARILKSWKD